MNRKLRSGVVSLAVLDQPDAVAGQAGDRRACAGRAPGCTRSPRPAARARPRPPARPPTSRRPGRRPPSARPSAPPDGSEAECRAIGLDPSGRHGVAGGDGPRLRRRAPVVGQRHRRARGRRGPAAAGACPRCRSRTRATSGSSTIVIAGSNWSSPSRTNERRSLTALPLNPRRRGSRGCRRPRRLEDDLVAAGGQLDRIRPGRGPWPRRGRRARHRRARRGAAASAGRHRRRTGPCSRAIAGQTALRGLAGHAAWPAELANAPVQWFVRQ